MIFVAIWLWICKKKTLQLSSISFLTKNSTKVNIFVASLHCWCRCRQHWCYFFSFFFFCQIKHHLKRNQKNFLSVSKGGEKDCSNFLLSWYKFLNAFISGSIKFFLYFLFYFNKKKFGTKHQPNHIIWNPLHLNPWVN